jgi:alanine dehydrogenase
VGSDAAGGAASLWLRFLSGPDIDALGITNSEIIEAVEKAVRAQRPGREREDERILLWHRGLAILDIAVGLAILRRAQEQDAGTMLRYR